MAQRLIQYQLVVWDRTGRKDVTISFRSTCSEVHDKVREILSMIRFERGFGYYVLIQNKKI